MNKSMQKVVDTIQQYMNEDESMIWHKPYFSTSHANAVSKKAYRGINHFTTSIVSAKEDYASPYWATFKQIKEMGGTLHDAKGKGVPIIFYKDLSSKDEADDADSRRRFVVRHSFVFNFDLVQGVDLGIVQPGAAEIVRDATAEAVIADYLSREKITVSIAAIPAYVPSTDTIKMPPIEHFVSQDELYSTYFHESAHSSGHQRRLARFHIDQVRYESKEDYSREELCAEICSAGLCQFCGVDSEASIKNSAAYIQGWSRFIIDNAQAFVSAVNQAYKARDFILNDVEQERSV